MFVMRYINQHPFTLLWMDQRLKSGEILRRSYITGCIKWIKGDEPSYTFQLAQYKDTWSRLD